MSEVSFITVMKMKFTYGAAHDISGKMVKTPRFKFKIYQIESFGAGFSNTKKFENFLFGILMKIEYIILSNSRSLDFKISFLSSYK